MTRILVSSERLVGVKQPLSSYTCPLFQISRLLGLLPLRTSPTVSNLYTYTVTLAVVLYFVFAKAFNIWQDWKGYTTSSMGVISLLLVVTIGLPDLLCLLSHVWMLRSEGSRYLERFQEFRLEQAPVLYPKYVTSFGVVLTATNECILWYVGDGEILMALSTATSLIQSYVIMMQFCTYLDLLKVNYHYKNERGG